MLGGPSNVSEFVSGTLLCCLKTNTEADAAQFAQQHGLQLHRFIKVGNIAIVEVPSGEENKFMDVLRADPNVICVEREHYMKIQAK